MNPLIKIFIYIVVATVFFIVANVVAGIWIAEKQGKFDWNVLKQSLFKYLGIIIVAILLYGGGYFSDEVLKEFVTDVVNVKNLVALGLATYAVNRANDAIANWRILTGLKEDKGGNENVK